MYLKNIHVSEYVKRIVLDKQITQKELAEKVGLSQSTISHIVNNEPHTTSTENIIAILLFDEFNISSLSMRLFVDRIKDGRDISDLSLMHSVVNDGEYSDVHIGQALGHTSGKIFTIVEESAELVLRRCFFIIIYHLFKITLSDIFKFINRDFDLVSDYSEQIRRFIKFKNIQDVFDNII